MSKRALLIGVDRYEHFDSLTRCVDDAIQMEALLTTHWDGSPNYHCTRLSTDSNDVTEASLRAAVRKLTKGANPGDDLLFYFSGHGTIADGEGTLVTQEAMPDDVGFPMHELLRRVNRCGAGSIMVVLDCCYSGEMGNTGTAGEINQVVLSEGVTILSASGPNETSREGGLNSLFTGLVISALDGGGADIRGYVSAASIYAYVEQALGPWQQRPMYKSYARKLAPLRLCKPTITDKVLRQLPTLFRSPDTLLRLDPSWEITEVEVQNPENVNKFNLLKKLRNGRLLDTEGDNDLYYLALDSKTASLSPLGQMYWQLAKKGII
jgi:hypothetical protein